MPAEIDSIIYMKRNESDVPWHREGDPIYQSLTPKEAIVTAKMNWPAVKVPLHLPDGRECGLFAVTRGHGGEPIGFVKKGFTPLQNEDAFDWFEPFITSGAAAIETAGSLRGGRHIWILAKLNIDSAEVVKGDEIIPYLLLANGHDGSLAVRAGFCPIRIVCENTLQAGITDSRSQLIRVLHKKKVKESLELVRSTIDLATQTFQASVEQYKLLAASACSSEDLRKLVQVTFFPKLDRRTITQKQLADAEQKALLTITSHVESLYEGGRGADLAGVGGTFWGAYNSITEYLQHVRGKSPELRLDSMWFGAGANLNARALKAATQMAAA